MKRVLFWILATVAAIALVLLLLAETEERIPTIQQNDEEAATSTTTDELADPAQPNEQGESSGAVDTGLVIEQPDPPADARPARVLRLADGDSFDMVWADTDERDEVRMFGINAPEGDACFGQPAREVLQLLTEDSELLIETIERDEFGRVLANVWSDGVFVNATMVELGAALALSDGGRYAGLITEAQAEAKATRSGLWDPSTCGADPSVNVRIAWIEANAPGRDDQNKNGEWIEIVNDAAIDADMSGWSVRDESTRHRYAFPDSFVLGAGDSVNVYSGCGDDTNSELYWCDNDPVWNNGGDTGFLVDPDGRFADSFSYDGS